MIYKNALISVSDKTGLVEFAQALARGGTCLISTGGTAKALRSAGLEVHDVSELTGFPEVMDGRVKTLHPHVHMGLLARAGHSEDEATLKKFSVDPFDLVVGNLYPFATALKDGREDLIEYIDIGGPSFLRASAKNYERISVICDPSDYPSVLNGDGNKLEQRRKWAAKVFSHTAAYDALIAQWMSEDIWQEREIARPMMFHSKLRYGENPQQKGLWLRDPSIENSLCDAKILQGKELSYNNILDLDATLECLFSFSDVPTAVATKHNNPCGVASSSNSKEALMNALYADPVSVFGGVVALNFHVEKEHAESLGAIFLECVVAPSYSDAALELFSKKKNMRVLSWPGILKGCSAKSQDWRLRSVLGGYLAQEQDSIHWSKEDFIFHGETPMSSILSSAEFIWRVCAALKSNAIAIASGQMTVGLGMGQVNRVDAVRQAIERVQKHHPNQKDLVLASDAFFPFADSIDEIAAAGIRWVVQPGGSLRDPEVFQKAKECGVNLIITARRHFRH